jgi:hypothetical protein
MDKAKKIEFFLDIRLPFNQESAERKTNQLHPGLIIKKGCSGCGIERLVNN